MSIELHLKNVKSHTKGNINDFRKKITSEYTFIP